MHTSTKNQAKGDVVLTDTTLANFDNSASVFTQKMKRWIQLLSGGLVFGLSLSMLGVTPAMAGSFTFTKIADNQGEFTSIGSSAINDSGTVAFVATLKDSSQTLYTSDGVSNTEIANLNNLSSPGISNINNNGTVVILETRLPLPISYMITQNLLVAQGGSLTTLASSFMDRFSNGRILDFALNQQDEVAYLSFSSGRGSNIYSLVFRRANQPDVRIASASNNPAPSIVPPDAQVDTLDSINFFDINNQGEVIFAATNKQSPPITAIFSVNGGERTRILETDASALRVNDKGNILLSNKDAIRLFDRSASTLRTIADTSSGSFKTFNDFYFAINNNDSVAFTATLNGGESGIFTGADPVADKVIATGDSLEGSTVTSWSLSGSAILNNLGQIAFYVKLANGEQAIYRADPVANKVIATGDSLEGSTVTDLNSPKLNNNGQIAFYVKLANGEQAIYRADPVTETDVSQSEPQVEDGGKLNTPL